MYVIVFMLGSYGCIHTTIEHPPENHASHPLMNASRKAGLPGSHPGP